MASSNRDKKILSLCDFSGVWSAPYRENGYEVIQVDLQHGLDVRTVQYPGKVHGILAAPPCTIFAGSGARWWEEKGDEALCAGLALVDACLRFVAVCKPEWWCLENPVGRLNKFIGPYKFKFDPYEFAKDFPEERYTKKTCLYGEFSIPKKNWSEIDPVIARKIHFSPDSKPRANRRSKTPEGFARAFYEANK